ncbi:hypothetical protein JB92DRAFT_2831264 [Gautieria morchelliformis]|nr:hypothetical protein JB92DRAFT_2831264 [Gautieria morchelliformis]
MNGKIAHPKSENILDLESLEFPPNLFVKADWQLANCRVLAGWMENSDGTLFYMPFTPILYQDGQCDVNNVFLDEALFDVFNVIIRSPSALDCELGVRSGTMTMDVTWELPEVTPGAIAAAATFGDFNIYLRYLSSGHEENKPSVKWILKIWNNYFIPATSNLDTIVAASVQAVNDAFAVLEEDEEVGPTDQHDIISPNHLPTHDNAAIPDAPPTTSIPSDTHTTRKWQVPIQVGDILEVIKPYKGMGRPRVNRKGKLGGKK